MSWMDKLSLGFKSSAQNNHNDRPPLGRFFNGAIHDYWNGDDISYENSVKEGYENNAIVQRCVRILSDAIGNAPLNINDEKITQLVSCGVGNDLLETLAAHIILHGNAFVKIIAPDDNVAQLYPLRPERVKIITDYRGWPMRYEYRVGDQTEIMDAYDAHGRLQIIHIKSFHPSDDHYGLGCLKAASQSISVHNAATRWNRSILDNAARPSGALIYDGGDHAVPLSDAQFDRLRSEMEQSFNGSHNAGRPMLLEGGLSWQAMSLSPTDMDFVALKATTARDIALAFGVPPMLLGIPGDNSYANYREANRALWRLSILPLLGKILSSLQMGLSSGDWPWFDNISMAVDLDKITALSEDRERLWAQVSAADFLTDNEKRTLLGLTDLGLTDLDQKNISQKNIGAGDEPS